MTQTAALHVLGSINLDRVCEVPALPRPGETILARRASTGPGGKGANQAVAAARYGARVHLHGAVGADEAGRRLRSRLMAEGVDVSAVIEEAASPTGEALVLVAEGGENMIVVTQGANLQARFHPEGVTAPTVRLAQLETSLEAVEAMFTSAAAGDVLILNAAPAAVAARRLLPLADVLILNAIELRDYAGPEGDLEAAARRLLARPDQSVVVTLGAGGALTVGSGEAAHHPGLKARPVDTTGAGDCFSGVLAAALAEGAPLAGAVRSANAAAALSVETRGAGAAPSRREIETRLGLGT